MDKVLSFVPLWLIVVVVIVGLSLLVYLTVRGVNVKTNLLTVNTRPVVDKRKNEISSSHIVQFRKLSDSIRGDMIRSVGEFKSLFRGLFIVVLRECLKTSDDLSQHKETIYYELILQLALESGYYPNVKKTIFGNHFPVRGIKRKVIFDESQSEYEKRFFIEYTVPTVDTILTLTSYDVTSNWRCKVFSRSLFEKRVADKDFMDIIYAKMNKLLVSARDRRDYVFVQIERQDGTSIQKLKDEWEMIYG